MPLASGYASIAVCDRCCFKYPYQELRADGNSPGLRVCEECRDPKDPWRLPPARPDAIALKYPRPDTPLWPPTNPGVQDGIPFWDAVDMFWDDSVTRWAE